ncbi:hypothetical protein ACRAVF_31255 [Bradyrhizobium oligotrophicum S58]
MQANEAQWRKWPTTPRAALAASILAVFLFLHVVAAMMLQGAARGGAQANPAAALQACD